jgi:hypothetical protein
VKALETRWRGHRFRSRTEARWAVFLDTYGVRWEYEPESFSLGGVNYLPDFRVHLSDGRAIWLEVKGMDGCDEHELRGPHRLGAYVVFGPPSPFLPCHNTRACYCPPWVGKLATYGNEEEVGECFCFNDRRDYRTWDMNNAAVLWEQDEKTRWDYCGPLARKAIETTRRERFGAYE